VTFPVPPERILLAKKLRESGLTYQEIGDRLGVPNQVAYRYVRADIDRVRALNEARRDRPDGTWLCGTCKSRKPRDQFLPSNLDKYPNSKCHGCEMAAARAKGRRPALERLPHPPDGKICRTCRVAKELPEFRPQVGGSRGVSAHCRTCEADRRRANPRDLDEVRPNGLTVKENIRDKRMIRKYGINLATFKRMLAEQGGCCAICLRDIYEEPPAGSSMRAVIDHCHATGRVRGLLCTTCNVALGGLADDTGRLINAIQYLRGALPPELSALFVEELRPLVEGLVKEAAREL
jgi:hypothetical protein